MNGSGDGPECKRLTDRIAPSCKVVSAGSETTRRDVLRRAGGVVAAAAGLGWSRTLVGADPPATEPATSPATTRPAAPTTGPAADVSRVVDITSPKLVRGRWVHQRLLGEMLDRGLNALMGTRRADDAWRKILSDEDVVGLKFSQSAQSVIGTSEPLAIQLVESLTRAGIDPQRIVLIEVGGTQVAKLGTRRPRRGWTSWAMRFGQREDPVAAVVEQVTALINVPFLKTHNLAQMSGAMKNLSYGLIRHPAWFHRNGCDPYIAEICAADPLRSRLRLNLVDAMRIVFDRGPAATEATLHDYGGLLFSRDILATDVVGQAILDEHRAARELAKLAAAPGQLRQHRSASRLRLGRGDLDHIRRVRISG